MVPKYPNATKTYRRVFIDTNRRRTKRMNYMEGTPMDSPKRNKKDGPKKGFFAEFRQFIANKSKSMFESKTEYEDEFPRRCSSPRHKSPMRIRAMTPLPFGQPRNHSPRRSVSPSKGRKPLVIPQKSNGIIQKCTDFYCTRLCSMIGILCVVSNMCSFVFAKEDALIMMSMSVIVIYHLQMIQSSHALMAVIILFNLMLMMDTSYNDHVGSSLASSHDLVAISFMHVLVIAILYLVTQPPEMVL